ARLGGRPSADSVLGAVEVTPSADANVLRVSAGSGSSARAVQLANAYLAAVLAERWKTVAPQLDRRIADLQSRSSSVAGSGAPDQLQALRNARADGADPTLQVLQPAASATADSSTSALLVLILALAGGAFLGVLAAVGLDHLGGSLRDQNDALAAYPLPVWGRVPRAEPAAAYQSLAAHVDRWCPESGSIALISASAGDGRTTAAAELAAALAERGRTSAFVYAAAPPEDSLVARLEGAGVLLLSAGPAGVGELLEEARGRVDIAVIDGPPVTRGTELLELTRSADLLLVARIGHTGRRDLRTAKEVLEGIGARPAGLLLLGIGRRRIERSAPAPPDERQSSRVARMP
ncbi:MAG: hypothetical protein ACXVRH_11885, partial [Thermoleophilaceae bacterium]